MTLYSLQKLDMCRAATETSIAMAYRLADTLAAHGATEALDMDAAMQVIHSRLLLRPVVTLKG